MRVAGILPFSMVNGEGIRYVIFVQGCGHHCKGCHNPETWDFNGGAEMSTVEIADDFNRRKLLDGITLSGGDPFYQQEACLDLISQLNEGTNIWIYTGFEYDEIKDTELAKKADVIVSGPYIEELRCEGKMYGSSNQEIHRQKEK